MKISLDGRVAVITGGSRGLGLATARRFREAGADVILLARREDILAEAKSELELAPGGRLLSVRCDVTSAQDIAAAYDTIMSKVDHVDILVNNAGSSKTMKFLDVTDEDWEHDLELKLFASIRLCRLFLPRMMSRRWGRIINVLNIASKAPGAGSAPTSVSRAAGLALTKVLAAEAAPHNVLVNALMVGFLVSDQIARSHAKSGKAETLDELISRIGDEIPIGRMGTADEFATAATFLASDAASYITGVGLNVDGGDCPVP